MAGREEGFAPRPQIFKVRQPDLDVNRQSEPMVDLANNQSTTPYMNSNIVEDIEFEVKSGTAQSAFVTVKHGLGREYRGWHVVRNNTPLATFCEDSSNNTRKDTQIILRADFPVTIPGDISFKIGITVF